MGSMRSIAWPFLLGRRSSALSLAIPCRPKALSVGGPETGPGNRHLKDYRTFCNIVGGVISPLLANVYLHHVLDEWFHRDVLPRLDGRAFLVRYADDFVMCFSHEADACRVHAVLAKRFGRFGLTLHPAKTRLVAFLPPDGRDDDRDDPPDHRSGKTFNLLGFTHYWSRSRKGRWVVKRKTAADRFSRAVHRVSEWLRRHYHRPLREQHAYLSRAVRGHCGYYGITGNSYALSRFRDAVRTLWRKWLSRRSQRGDVGWERYAALLRHYPLPPPTAVHSIYCRSAARS